MEFASPSQSKPTGLKLVLPSLKSVLAAKNNKKASSSFSYPTPVEDVIEIEKKPPRPAKLKPLKEVLARLIAQIKRKDDYAFFLEPVDAENIPGYLDVVKSPMDLGTMANKVNRGRYRSLDDFAADFRLVTTNAKIFNPPGSIYYIEADRMEVWGLDHINKAAGTVIQHEADWNIDIEKEDDTPTVNIEDEDDERMDIDDQSRARSVSVQSQPQPSSTRRGPRGPYKKQAPTNSTQVSESVDAEGRLPGSKDGIGAFPASSDWAKTMLMLKLKGKRYRTKKERMRIEREGPPVLPEGSLDYTEMEDPFSVLSNLVPDPPSRPALTPLYTPIFINENLSYPTATTVAPSHTPPAVPDVKQRRHWTIARNINARQKAKDRDEEPEVVERPAWQVPRESCVTDFGSLSILAGELAEEMRRRGMTPCSVQEGQEQEINLDWIREGLEAPPQPAVIEEPPRGIYWTKEKASEGEYYLRDLVYGGVDGLAYVRSLAEFMRYDEPPGEDPALGLPLAQWVEQNVVDNLTGGRHSLIREAAAVIEKPFKISTPVARQAMTSLRVYPVANAALSTLRSIGTHKIDMASLIKTPEELFLSEEEWHGKELKERRKQGDGVKAEKMDEAMEVEEPEPSWVTASNDELEGPEELKEVLEYVAAVIVDLNRRNLSKGDPAYKQRPAKTEKAGSDETEDPVLRNLRLNLLALAKRAPLDTIARLPKDLVPEHIRQFVPTLGSST